MTTPYEEWRGFAYYYGNKIGITDNNIDEFAFIVGEFVNASLIKR